LRRQASASSGGHAAFVCELSLCRRRIFAERFGDGIVPVRSRRTARLEYIVHHLGLALGGRPAAALARRLMLPVSNDTLLRVVRRRTWPRTDPLVAAGIDDWAFPKNHCYGTIVCDLERRRIVALLPDREIATVRAWLSEHPEIRVVSRDRGGGFGEAAAQAVPDALWARFIASTTRLPLRLISGRHSVHPVATSTIVRVWMNEPATDVPPCAAMSTSQNPGAESFSR
jgi:hypothetical protein